MVARLPGTVPDGLLYVACYEPSQVLRLETDGTATVIAHDPTAHLLCHPTNLAFRGTTMLVANLARRTRPFRTRSLLCGGPARSRMTCM